MATGTKETLETMTQLTPVLVSLLGPVIGLICGYFLARKKYAFEKIYELRLICIKDLHEQVVNLEFILKKYIQFVGADMKKESTNERISSLKEVKDSFQKFQHKFWREEIILDESTAESINDFLKKYIEITAKLTVSNIQHQQDDYGQSFDNWNKSFDLVQNDLVKIKNELKEKFRKTLKIYKP